MQQEAGNARVVGVIVGSNRRESTNRKLADAIVQIGAPTLRFVDVQINDLPMYNEDLEVSRPEVAHRFARQVADCSAVLIVMPEHNRSLPALLKNAIDWGSRPIKQNVWKDKPMMITGTSPGAIGTAVGQQHLRQILGDIGATLLGGECYITWKPTMLDAQGGIADESTTEFLRGQLSRFERLIALLLKA